jgi:hypothetical protein
MVGARRGRHARKLRGKPNGCRVVLGICVTDENELTGRTCHRATGLGPNIIVRVSHNRSRRAPDAYCLDDREKEREKTANSGNPCNPSACDGGSIDWTDWPQLADAPVKGLRDSASALLPAAHPNNGRDLCRMGVGMQTAIMVIMMVSISIIVVDVANWWRRRLIS